MATTEETNTETGETNTDAEATGVEETENRFEPTSRELTREVLEEISESIPKIQARSYLDSEVAIARGVTRDQFVGQFSSVAAAGEFETRVLATEQWNLPAEAIAVLEGNGPSPGYWAFLLDALEHERNRR